LPSCFVEHPGEVAHEAARFKPLKKLLTEKGRRSRRDGQKQEDPGSQAT
jgi:hypothetical protein